LSATSIYVYYRIEPARLPELRRAVEQLFAAIQRDSGIRGRWQRRRDDPTTYMEIYPAIHDLSRFEAALARECDRLGIERLLAPGGGRRVERFVDAD
jgi:Domain of unknown function (DUF4936)